MSKTEQVFVGGRLDSDLKTKFYEKIDKDPRFHNVSHFFKFKIEEYVREGSAE